MKNRNRLAWLFLVFLLALSSCTGQQTPVPTSTQYPGTATLPPLTATPLTAQDKIRLALAKELGISADDVQVQVIEAAQWSDSCLGAPAEGETCAQTVTSGYSGILIVQGVLYEFHSDQSGEKVRFIPGAAITASEILTTRLGVERKTVRVVSVEPETWHDSCLEIAASDRTCSPAEIPGYRVILDVRGKHYEYHTDESGSDVQLAVAPEPKQAAVLISWTQASGAECQKANIGSNTVVFGTCGGVQMEAPFVSAERVAEVLYLVETFAPFEADTLAGKISLAGKGKVTATPTDQRMSAEWARLVMQEALGGRGGAAWGLVFAWHREGGIAGLCEDVTIYLSGIAFASTCRGNQSKNLGQMWLTANQMSLIYGWVDSLQSFEYQSSEPASLDEVAVQMIFSGNGQGQPGEFEQTRLTTLADQIITQVQTTPNPDDLSAARAVLISYFSALLTKNYNQVVTLYGGSYQELANNNPSISPTNYTSLFQAGCTLNGFVCNLMVRNFVREVQLSATDFRFTVEMQNPDGSLFVLGPCCGADPQKEPSWTQFDFLVKKVDGVFKVQDLPVYVP